MEIVERAFALFNQKIFDVEVGIWLAALLLLLIGFVLRGWVSKIAISRLNKLANRTENTLDDDLIKHLKHPIELLVLIGTVYLAISLVPFNQEGRQLADKALTTVLLYALFRSFIILTEPLLNLTRSLKTSLNTALIEWLKRIVRVVLVILGAGAIFEVWGVPIASIIAGLGIAGAAIALGAQELFKNLISGIMIIAEKRFEVGDWIKVDGVVEGTVEWIGFRSSRIKRFDLGPVYVPNRYLADQPLTNFSNRDHRRIYMNISLEYATSKESLLAIRATTMQWIADHPKIESPDNISTFVVIDHYADSSIALMIYCFTTTTDWGEWLDVKQELLLALKGIVADHQSNFAYPTQSLYIKESPAHQRDQAHDND